MNHSSQWFEMTPSYWSTGELMDIPANAKSLFILTHSAKEKSGFFNKSANDLTMTNEVVGSLLHRP